MVRVVRLVSLVGVLRTGGHGGELCKSLNRNWSLGNVVWCGVLWSDLVQPDLVWRAKVARLNWFSYI